MFYFRACHPDLGRVVAFMRNGVWKDRRQDTKTVIFPDRWMDSQDDDVCQMCILIKKVARYGASEAI